MKTRTKPAKAVDQQRLVRPDSSGWWQWYEGQLLDDDPEEWEGATGERLLTGEGGTHIASDDEWWQATGENPDKDTWHGNYWEGTETTQHMMPGLWGKVNVKVHPRRAEAGIQTGGLSASDATSCSPS